MVEKSSMRRNYQPFSGKISQPPTLPPTHRHLYWFYRYIHMCARTYLYILNINCIGKLCISLLLSVFLFPFCLGQSELKPLHIVIKRKQKWKVINIITIKRTHNNSNNSKWQLNKIIRMEKNTKKPRCFHSFILVLTVLSK